jgi:putative protein-disulfide isomerase
VTFVAACGVDGDGDTAAMTARFLYLFDPLCGWCYGAAPAIRWLREQPGVVITPQPVGMFAWEQAIPLSRMRDHIRPADARIAALTGQVFSEDYFRHVIDAPDGVVNSGPATLALFRAEQQSPGSSLGLLADIQTARYGLGRDVTAAAELEALAARHGIALDLGDAAAEQAARRWAAEGAAMLERSGARGVPTLLQNQDTGWRSVPSDHLYQRRDRLAALLAA